MGLADSFIGLQIPLALVAAPFVGSFLGLVALRTPKGVSVVTGRSRCDACGKSLGALDLIPVLSWIASGARCRHCAISLPLFYPAIELAALALVAWAAVMTEGLVFWLSCGLGCTLLTLAVIDLRHFILPDKLTLPLVLAGLLSTWLVAPASLGDHFFGAAVGYGGFVLLRALYFKLRGREGLGLGDAKLMAAAGAWLSWQALPAVVALAALAGLFAVVLIRVSGSKVSATDRIPFGPCICLAIWTVWLYGTPMLL